MARTMDFSPKRKRLSGFSILEFMLCIALLAIVIAISLPSYRSLVVDIRLRNLANRIHSVINFARLRAFSHAEKIVLCGSSDGLKCNSDWRLGRILVRNSNRLLKISPPFPTGYHLFWRSSLGWNQNLSFIAQGVTAGSQGRFIICGPRGHQSIELIILRSGRLRINYATVNPLCFRS